MNITSVVATHNVPNLVDSLPKEGFAFTMASPFIVVPMQRHVKPLLDVTALDSLFLFQTNLGILPTMMKLVLLVLPTPLVFLLYTIQ